MPAPRPLKRLLPVVLAALVGLLAISGDAGAQTPGAPAITSVTAGDGSLAVAWTAGNQGGSTITSYDLRHIETDADETVDTNWTVETGIWTSGSLEYTVDGLDGDVSYDVQVRAVNTEGSGDWSSTSVGTPLIGAPAIDSVIVGDGALTISWSEPPHAAKATIASYDLRYIETSADETVDSNWTVEETVWTRGSRVHVLDGLTNTTGYDVQVRAVTSSAAAWSTTATGTPPSTAIRSPTPPTSPRAPGWADRSTPAPTSTTSRWRSPARPASSSLPAATSTPSASSSRATAP